MQHSDTVIGFLVVDLLINECDSLQSVSFVEIIPSLVVSVFSLLLTTFSSLCSVSWNVMELQSQTGWFEISLVHTSGSSTAKLATSSFDAFWLLTDFKGKRAASDMNAELQEDKNRKLGKFPS